MARLFIDGFESGSLDLWDSQLGVEIDSSLAGRKGTYCAYFPSGQTYMIKNITSSTEVYVAMLIYPYQFQASIYQRVMFNNGSTTLGLIGCDGSGYIKTYRASTSNLLATSTNPLNLTTWQLLEIHYKSNSSSGVFQVKVNGITEIDYSGNTGTTTNTDKIQIGTATYSFLSYIDNFIVDDSAWIGDTSIQVVYPTGTGTSTNWSAKTLTTDETNYNCVAEIPTSDTDYIYTNTADILDTYETSDIAAVNSIQCVQVQARALKQGAATPVNLKLAIRSGSTNYLSANKAIQAATPKSVYNLWALDPDTSSAWNQSGVNAMEIGVKSAS